MERGYRSRLVVATLSTLITFLIDFCEGHKQLHEPVLHFPQMMYFIAFTSVMVFPNLLAEGFQPMVKGALAIGLGTRQ